MMNTKRISLALPGFWRLILIMLLALALFPLSPSQVAMAAEPAGKVDAVIGNVTVAGADGAIRVLAKDAPVFSGDIISTGPNSKVRILFSDNAIIFLRPATRFVIDSYRHTGNVQQDESIFSLVKGGFRAVTGAIGHANKDKVRIETPVATIGIRGTDHEGRFCAGDCLDLTNIGVSAPPDGLYTSTNVGRTVVGSKLFGAGQYGFTSSSRITVHLPEPPPILVKDPMLREGLLSMSDAEDQGQDAAPAAEEGKAQEERPVRQETGEQEQQPEKTVQATQAEQGEPAEPEGEDGFEIPAKPLTTQAVQCR